MSRNGRNAIFFALLASVTLLETGCGGDEGVRTYRVPHAAEATVKTEAGMPVGASGYRILGAMYPADDPNWFFKLAGPADQVAKFEADFDKLASSVDITNQRSIPGFTLPAGWLKGGPRPGFVPVAETIKLPGSPLEITIIQSLGGVQSNVDRWVNQVGQTRSSSKITRTFDAVGCKGLRVDVTGPTNPTGGPMMGRMKK